jgi:hypothetical protein
MQTISQRKHFEGLLERSGLVAKLEAEDEERRSAERKEAVAALELIRAERAKTTPITAGPMLLAEAAMEDCQKALNEARNKYWMSARDHWDSEQGFDARASACQRRLETIVPEWFTDVCLKLARLVEAVKAEQRDGILRPPSRTGYGFDIIQTTNLNEIKPILDDVSAKLARLKQRPFEAITDAELRRHSREATEDARAKATKIVPAYKVVNILGTPDELVAATPALAERNGSMRAKA